MSGPIGPMWFDPAPPGYPWPVLVVPVNITSLEEAERLVDEIKEAGNNSLRGGDNYDAVWKYNHALVLCRDHHLPLPKVAIINSNCAQACLNLKYYMQAFTHADGAIKSDPHSVILDKSFHRRAEASKMLYKELVSKDEMFSFPPHNRIVQDAIGDYCHSFYLKGNNCKAVCEAIILAVDNSVEMPMAFRDIDIVSGSTTKVLQELLSRPDSKHVHLDFLLNEMKFHGTLRNYFNCASIQFEQVCKKSLGKRLLRKMFSLGMTITPEEVAHAVELLPDTKTATLDVIAANCEGPPHESLTLAYVAAEKLNKPQLLECLVIRGASPPVSPQERVAKAKEEGNKFYRNNNYNEALSKYYQALPLCQQHKLEGEEALIRGNCAQACLQLELFKDAYEHANECLRLDPESSKGYYRRAEALRKMLESRDWKNRAPKGTSFSSVVSDYFQCHRKSENIKAIYQAIVVATNHNCTKDLPKLTEEEIASGLATKILLELVQRDDSEQKHFSTLVLTLVPAKQKDCIDASSLQVTDLLKHKSITSPKLIKRLLELGMKVSETDVSSAVQILQECHSGTLRLLLKECLKNRKSTFTSACQVAIKTKKFQFIVCLIDNGGLPDFEDLKDATGWPEKNVDPTINRYLMENIHSRRKEDAVRRDVQDKYPPSLEPFVRLARQAHAEGKVLHKAGRLLEAQQKYDDALAVCQDYNLKYVACEIYYSFAKLHILMEQYQTAYTECTVSLNIRPESKMHYVRGEVLRMALATPLVRVPPGLDFQMVISDYCESHRLKDSVKALSQAIIVAVDHRCTEVLKYKYFMIERHVESGFCTELLLNLLKRPDVKEMHVKFLVTEMPIRSTKPYFDGSKVDISVLIRKKFAHRKTLEVLFKCGMKVKQKDLEVAIETLATISISIVDDMCTHFDGDRLEALKIVFQNAMKLKRIKLVHHVLKKGCKLQCSSQEILTLAIQKDSADIAESLLPSCILSEVDLGQLMSTKLVNHPQLILKMIDAGVNPNGLGERRPLAEVQQLGSLSINRRMDLICLLLEKGCDCADLCAGSKIPTTPVHVATTIGLEAGGNTRVLDVLVASPSFSVEPDGKLIDGKGDTPLHLAVNSKKFKRETSFKVLKALIETHRIPIDPSICNQNGKRAIDLIHKNDKRVPILKMAADKLQQRDFTGKQSQEEENSAPEEISKPHSETMNMVDNTEKPMKKSPYQMMNTMEKLEFHLRIVFRKEEDYFVPVKEQPIDDRKYDVGQEEVSENAHNSQMLKVDPGKEIKKSLSPQPQARENEESEMNTVMSNYGLDDFDDLPWEVEVTNNVLKFFKSEKEHPYTLRLRAAETVYELAEGKRGRGLSKELSSQTPSLFEARISKGARILWQTAIQFSPRRTGEHSNPIYAQVIRIWEIVPDHDQLNLTIKHCVKQIELSNEKGQLASLNVSLLPQKQPKIKPSARQQEVLEIPKIFTQTDITSSGPDIEHYTPAASPKKDEFNVTTFYSFSGAVLKSMLTGSNARRDFPFKEWPKEHEIINLPSNRESILLLGRSGTGKTTCCLYRLWNEFKLYWDRPEIIMLPRKPLVSLQLSDKKEDIDSDINSPSEAIEENVTPSDIFHTQVYNVQEQRSNETKAAESVHKEDSEDSCDSNDEPAENDIESEDSEQSFNSAGRDEVREIEEHLHQVFVTKNYVLCAQMKKRFYDMAASHDFLEDHMDWESRDMPHSLAEINDYAYPLFLTARQFYILLDNSIGKDECFFRPREKDGSLKVKILSSDYDHEDPDTLLDLEESESEGEDVPDGSDYALSSTAKQQTQKYVEVTSLYFTEHIWPNIAHKCSTKHLDPLLVWIEIQSFIKGSRTSLMKGSALLLEEYLQIGNKMAPNFANERERIYNLYKCYEEYCQNKRHSVFLFDECDLVHDIHRRLRLVQDLPWSIHSLYIDEVQDFTQAELALYLQCCRHPNSLFFTGDTAQSIMRGIAFRFQDLRSSFHAIHKVEPRVEVPQKPHTLTINFRSHSGILQLAGSIIDLLQMFFTGSIDHLPADKGMFPGPSPVILESANENDLALLLSSNKRESSRIEFGAHQVVIVQSKQAKERLPSILKGAIVLTVFESKGLEFDDVLLYNFFHDSMVDEKGWRVVTAYLEEHPQNIKVNKRFPGSSAEPRSYKFDEKCHKALNSELKYLYTAITRAKCNLWIYDSDKKKRLPMFDLWYKQDMVKVVGHGAENQESLIFASISTPQQWKIQGDYFMRRSRWEQARHCYDRAGLENHYLYLEANARLLVQTAMKQANPRMYIDAAIDFLHSDELTHNVQCLRLSAQCLRRARPSKLTSAAKLFERLKEHGKALACYRKARDTVNCVRLLEREGRYNEAVKMFRAPKQALAKACEYASKGIELSPDLLPENLSYMYARRYARLKDKATLLEVLEYMPDTQRRARFMKEGGLYDEALDVYVKHDELDDAYRLASGQCLFSRGREIAKKNQDMKKEAEFVFHQVQAEFLKSKGKETLLSDLKRGKEALSPDLKEGKETTLPSDLKEGKEATQPPDLEKENEITLPPDLKSDLDTLRRKGDNNIKAHANLLLGIAEKDAGLCRTAKRMFSEQHNMVAALEAFNELSKLSRSKWNKPTPREVLDLCTAAKEIQSALARMHDLNRLVKQATAFYGLQKVRDVHYSPPDHNMWVSPQLQSKCLVTNDEEKDLDGMLRLQSNATRDILASRIGSFVVQWLDMHGVQQEINRKLLSFKLHDDIDKKRFLLRPYTLGEVPIHLIVGYMQDLINYCDLGLVLNYHNVCNTAISLLITIFSPQVAIYLPLSRQHVVIVRSAVSIHKCFHHRIKREVDHDEVNRMDVWFTAWRACSLSDGHTGLVAGVLERLEEKVNRNFKYNTNSKDAVPTSPTSPTTSAIFSGMWKGNRFEAPPAFEYWRIEDYHYHIFNFWMYSCRLIRNEKKPLLAAKQAIYHFIGKVVQRKSLLISVMNLVDVLVVHCMSLFAMLTHLNYHQKTRATKFVVPLLYRDCVHLFDNLNCHKKGDTWVYTACADEVRRAIAYRRDFKLRNNCYNLLDAALNILLGTYRKDTNLPAEEQKRFKVLTTAFRNDKILSSGAAHHCLVLALTLFANLIPYQNQYAFDETRKTFIYIFSQISKQENMPNYMQEGREIFHQTSKNTLGSVLVQYVGRLLNINCADHGVTSPQALMMFDEKRKIIFSELPRPAKLVAKPSQSHSVSPQYHQSGQSVQPPPPPALNTVPLEPSIPPQHMAWGDPQFMSDAGYPPVAIQHQSEFSQQSFNQTMQQSGGPTLPMEASMFHPLPPTAAVGDLSQVMPSVEYTGPAQAATLHEMPGYPYQYPYGHMISPLGPITQPLEASNPSPLMPQTILENPAPDFGYSQEQEVPTFSKQENSALNTRSDEQPSFRHVQDESSSDKVSRAQVEIDSEQQMPPPISEEELKGEVDEDEEAIGMSNIRMSKKPILPPVDAALTDHSIVSEQFCNICGVSLRVERVIEDIDEPDEEARTQPEVNDSREVYDTHVRSENHAKNYTFHSKFKEDFDGIYTGMVDELKDMVQKCELTQAPALARVIDDMKESLEKYERKMSNRQTNLQWRMGINDIGKAVEEFQKHLNIANKEYQKIAPEVPEQRPLGEGDGAEDSDTEFDAEINQRVADDIDDHTLALRSEASKIESRVRKKSKKRKK